MEDDFTELEIEQALGNAPQANMIEIERTKVPGYADENKSEVIVIEE